MSILFGGQGADFLAGGNNIDVLVGFAGDDTLLGGDNIDILIGNQDDDLLVGDRGDDQMFGGQGDDRMVWNNGDGNDLIEGGNGNDTVEVNGSLEDGDQFVLEGNEERLKFERLNLGNFVLDVDDVEQFEINGGGGDDNVTIEDTTGTDLETVVFNGGEGNDTLDASESNVVVVADGGAGEDQLIGGSANDILMGGTDNDSIEGERGDDTMIGAEGNDTLEWDDGDGSDLISGGEGIDVVEVEGSLAEGDEFVLSQDGTNAIFDRVNLGQFTLTVDTSEEFEVDGVGGDDSFIVNDLSDTDVELVTFNGGEGNDTLDASQSNVPIVADGGEGDEILIGGAASDTLSGGEGNDEIFGGDEIDYLFGNDDHDTLVGDRGNDQMFGEDGDDRMVWNNGDGSDLIEGGAGNDTVEVNGSLEDGDQFVLEGNEERLKFERLNLGNFVLDVDDVEQFEINGDGGDDHVTIEDTTGTDLETVVFNGGEGNDTLDASESNVPIVADGGAGDDLLIGGEADDILIGGEGDNIVIGGGGNDILIGNLPNDSALGVINALEGGDGSDSFILGNESTVYYNDGDDATDGSGDYALLMDFDTSEDMIQLQGGSSQYVLNSISIDGISGTGLYLDSNSDGMYNNTDELVAVVEDVSIMSTEADYFSYV